MKILIRIGKEIKKFKWHYVAAITAILASSVIALAAPWIVSQMVGAVEAGVDAVALKKIAIYSGVLVGLYAIRAILKYFSSYLAHVAAWNLVNDTRVKLYDHMQRLPLSFFHDKQTGDLMSRAINDTANFEMLYAHNIPDIINNIVTFVGVTAVLLSTNYKLALLTSLPLPFIILGGWFFVKKIRPNFRKAQGAVAGLNSRLQDNLSGIHEIQAFGQEEREYQNVAADANVHTTAILKALKQSAVFHPSVEFFTSLGTVIVVGIGGYLAYKNSLNVSDVVAFLLYLTLFYTPVASMARLLEDTQMAYAGAERILSIMDTQSDITDAPNATELRAENGSIEFKNVSFGYNNDVKVLDSISFKCEGATMLALVGATGVGKTTLANLIPRFYEPSGGEILIDGKKIKDVTIKSLRDNIGMVLQDTFLFNGTILDNILYAKETATLDEVYTACESAKIHSEIMGMPNGYNTRVGERGVRLSGGQKQRIAIARAILRNSRIIIFDEATASVDTSTEKNIQEAIAKLSGKRTIIAIAHRLSTIQSADKILVIKDGKIAEQGSHQELINLKGIYYNMHSGGIN